MLDIGKTHLQSIPRGLPSPHWI